MKSGGPGPTIAQVEVGDAETNRSELLAGSSAVPAEEEPEGDRDVEREGEQRELRAGLGDDIGGRVEVEGEDSDAEDGINDIEMAAVANLVVNPHKAHPRNGRVVGVGSGAAGRFRGSKYRNCKGCIDYLIMYSPFHDSLIALMDYTPHSLTTHPSFSSSVHDIPILEGSAFRVMVRAARHIFSQPQPALLQRNCCAPVVACFRCMS